MAYCVQADIESILSAEGVVLATDDGRDLLAADSALVADAISRASARFEQYALQQYDTSDLAGNVWAKWCVATLAAIELTKRRGQVVPSSLQESADELIAFLKDVAAGEMTIPNAAVRAEQGVAMSNLYHDMRFRQAQVRVLPQISAGRASSEKPRRVDNSYNFER